MLRLGVLLKKAVEGWKSLETSLKILMCCGIMFDVALVMVVGGLSGWFAGTLWPGLILLGFELIISIVAMAIEAEDLSTGIAFAFLVLPLYAIFSPIMLWYGTVSCTKRIDENDNGMCG